jgi:hypothetical protein
MGKTLAEKIEYNKKIDEIEQARRDIKCIGSENESHCYYCGRYELKEFEFKILYGVLTCPQCEK